MRKKKASRARQSSSLKAETYMSTEAETLGPIRSHSRMHSSRFEPYDRRRIRTKKQPSRSYYEELGAVSPPPPGPYGDAYFEVPHGPSNPLYGDDRQHHPHPHYPPRHPSDEYEGTYYGGGSRSRSRSPLREPSRPSDSHKAHVQVVPDHSNDEYRKRSTAKDGLLEKKERNLSRREGPSLRDELRSTSSHMYVPDEGERRRRASSYEVPETYRSNVEIRRRDPRDNYMTGARHSDDSDDSHGAALAVPRPRR